MERNVSEAQSTIQCEGCRAVLTLPGAERAQVCPYCASPNVVAAPTRSEQPTFCLPHAQGEVLARRSLEDWQRTLGFFRHPGVRKATLEAFKGVYLPAVLYSATGRTKYSASIGEEYYVTETYTVTVNGRTETRTRQVKKHEWVPLSGEFHSYASDIIVSASSGIPNAELEAVEPFDLRGLRRYSPGLVAGWGVEAATRKTDDCIALARGEFVREVGSRLSGFMPGDTHSDLNHHSTVEAESAEPVLVPLWVLALKYDEAKPALRVLINGQTGKTWAKVPWSWPRIVGAIVIAVAAITGIALAIWSQQP